MNGLGDGASQTIVDLQPSAFQTSTGALDGTPVPYLVTESDPTDPRYRLVGIECLAGTTVKYVSTGGPFLDPSTVAASVDLLPGEDVVCTFTNDFVDLRSTKTDSLDPVVPGVGGLSYTLTVTNNGTGRPSTAATVYDSLAAFPAGVVFTAPAPADCSYDAAGRLATCTIAADLLDAGESANVVLPVTVPADVSVAPTGATFDNRASVDVPEDSVRRRLHAAAVVSTALAVGEQRGLRTHRTHPDRRPRHREAGRRSVRHHSEPGRHAGDGRAGGPG